MNGCESFLQRLNSAADLRVDPGIDPISGDAKTLEQLQTDPHAISCSRCQQRLRRWMAIEGVMLPKSDLNFASPVVHFRKPATTSWIRVSVVAAAASLIIAAMLLPMGEVETQANKDLAATVATGSPDWRLPMHMIIPLRGEWPNPPAVDIVLGTVPLAVLHRSVQPIFYLSEDSWKSMLGKIATPPVSRIGPRHRSYDVQDSMSLPNNGLTFILDAAKPS